MTLEFLLRAWRRTGDAATLEMVTRTLDAMADGGIHDQLGGGFARYSTDAHWLVPHFEKMLYDNALLAHAYLEGYRATGEERYADVARRTLDFMLAELRTDDGGFASALDADSEGVEGRFYVWADDELSAVLADAGLDPDERRAVSAAWGVTSEGNWEGTNVLHRPAGPSAPPELVERASLALLAARSARTRPARDDKQIAAWNGLALRALAHATLVLGEARYRDATVRTGRIRRARAGARRGQAVANRPRRAGAHAGVLRGCHGRCRWTAGGAWLPRNRGPAAPGAGTRRPGDRRLLGRGGRDLRGHLRPSTIARSRSLEGWSTTPRHRRTRWQPTSCCGCRC